VLRNFRHALAVEVYFADTFDAREHVINGLAPDAHQFGPYDACHKIARKIQNLLWRRALETFAKNRRHGTSECLHFGTKRHADVRFPVLIDMQIHPHRIRAIFVLAHIDKIEILTFAGLLFRRVVRVGNKRLAPLIFRERFEEIDNLVQLGRILWRLK
jgi:hypothetical protein